MPLFQLNNTIKFPLPELAEPNGLLAIGGDLSPDRLIEAYRLGIFPWYSEKNPILWWSPAPRLVLFPDKFHLPKRLARLIRQHVFTVTADTAFFQVIENCAQRKVNPEETWITPDMKRAYCRLHELGFAHSIECWEGSVLAGGLYGIALDRVFFGESMFSNVSNGSKIALHYLVQHSARNGIRMIDCQMKTEHLVRFGAQEISRVEFQEKLHDYVRSTAPQKKWRLQNTNKKGIGSADACQEEKII